MSKKIMKCAKERTVNAGKRHFPLSRVNLLMSL
jgi:hypothetical protein